MHAVPVPLPGLDAGDEGVPHEAVDLGELDALLGTVVLDEAQLDALGDLGEEREVDPSAVVRRTEGVGLAGPDLHWGLPSGVGGATSSSRCGGGLTRLLIVPDEGGDRRPSGPGGPLRPCRRRHATDTRLPWSGERRDDGPARSRGAPGGAGPFRAAALDLGTHPPDGEGVPALPGDWPGVG